MAGLQAEMNRTGSCNVAVSTSNVFKSFSAENRVLNGLNMNVLAGTIYGLLGPSGCGKTTLINIILGKLSLDSGIIKLNTTRFSDIGYMPQDLSLDTLLTIQETFEYYGSLYKMNESEIVCKSKEIIAWLKLPTGGTLLKDLSGGQCRRVSLGVTLLHDPKIIILDEPTVGVDAVLRYEIWKKLLKIVREQAKTIIITTHYIEEARQAQTIGLMRNGVLIDEAPPQDILLKQNTDSLEMAFLSMSYGQQIDIASEKVKPMVHGDNGTLQSTTLQSDGRMSATRIRAFIKKNVALCSRDHTFIFFVFLFPMAAATVFNFAVGGNVKNVNIAVSNEETAGCRGEIQTDGCIYDNDNNLTLSCEVLDALRHSQYNLIMVDNRKAGDVLVKKLDSIAFIQFPQHFSKALQKYALGKNVDSNQTFSPESFAYVNIDSGNFLIKNEVTRNIYNIFYNVIVNSTRNCNVRLVNNPFKIEHLVGDKVVKYTHSIATMFVSMIGFYFSCEISTEFMLTEKMEGFLDRSMTAGITILEVIISITSIQTVIHIIQSILVIFMTYVVFDNPIEITNGLFAFTFLIVLTGWLGLIYGLIIVGLSKSTSEAMNMVISWTIIQLYLSGIIWPIEAQMPIMKTISEHLPMCYISRLLNDIVLRGWTIRHPTVLIGVVSIFGFVFLHVIILLYLSRFKKDAWLVKK